MMNRAERHSLPNNNTGAFQGAERRDSAPFSQLTRQAEKLDENRIVLYKKGRQLGNGYYVVEISSNNVYAFICNCNR